MPKRKLQLVSQKLFCSICQDVLKDTVKSLCGHSFCSNCIHGHWDEENDKGVYSCPQCGKRFSSRPNPLKKQLEEDRQKLELQDLAAVHNYAGPEDVDCDVCTERKMKAVKSCLVCLVSYCEKHLQHHQECFAFMKHNMAEPPMGFQKKICPDHNKVKMTFCCTIQQWSSCPSCNLDQHKDHETAESNEKPSRLDIRERILEREKALELLQEEILFINTSIDEAVDLTEVRFAQMIRLLKTRSHEEKAQLRYRQQTAVKGIKELQEKLKQEIAQLKREDEQLEQLEQLTNTEDSSQFVHNSTSASPLCEPTPYFSVETAALGYLHDVEAAVAENRDNLKDLPRKSFSQRNTEEEELLTPQPQPEAREDFLQYSKQIHMDPNTANRRLLLSDRDQEVTHTKTEQCYPSHPDRFITSFQVLSRESLTGRCYWEVECKGTCDVAVTYNNIPRSGYGSTSVFGLNDKSWCLAFDTKHFTFLHNMQETYISVPVSSRVGVYLDHRAGILSFYSITQTMTLLHRVKTTFIEPLHAGITVYVEGDSAKLVKPQ